MRAKDAVGRYGEDVAARHLEATGLRVVERNWRCPDGEIDIVAWHGSVLVFCEVKTRSGAAFGVPAAAVTPVKAARIRRLACRYLLERRPPFTELRFDVVGVVRQPRGAASVEHLPAAF